MRSAVDQRRFWGSSGPGTPATDSTGDSGVFEAEGHKDVVPLALKVLVV